MIKYKEQIVEYFKTHSNLTSSHVDLSFQCDLNDKLDHHQKCWCTTPSCA
jgi:hypothetical protein